MACQVASTASFLTILTRVSHMRFLKMENPTQILRPRAIHTWVGLSRFALAIAFQHTAGYDLAELGALLPGLPGPSRQPPLGPVQGAPPDPKASQMSMWERARSLAERRRVMIPTPHTGSLRCAKGGFLASRRLLSPRIALL